MHSQPGRIYILSRANSHNFECRVISPTNSYHDTIHFELIKNRLKERFLWLLDMHCQSVGENSER